MEPEHYYFCIATNVLNILLEYKKLVTNTFLVF